MRQVHAPRDWRGFFATLPRPCGRRASRVALLALAGLAAAGLIGAAQAPRVGSEATPVLGTGKGLDHVVIAVRDLDYVERVYASVLGFTPVRRGSAGSATRHSILPFGSTFLELITVTPLSPGAESGMPELRGFLAQREGARFVGLDVSSATKTADFLRGRHLDVTGPEEAMSAPIGAAGHRTVLWRTVRFRKPVVPSDAIFFIEYAPGLERSAVPRHENGALGVHAVWMAVNDLQAAARACESVGLPPGKAVQAPRLAAAGREVPVGQGVILLLHGTDQHGVVSSSLAEHGEGILGVSIEVRDLSAVQTFIENSTEQTFPAYDGPFGKSILISASLTYGVWMEFFQRQ
jgi:catechol 2,3-dioxygenase-like lactoylglutathione lyase family enzyme